MITFLKIALCFFAACAAGGMTAPFLLAARNRTWPLALLALATGVFAVAVLIASAVELP